MSPTLCWVPSLHSAWSHPVLQKMCGECEVQLEWNGGSVKELAGSEAGNGNRDNLQKSVHGDKVGCPDVPF